MATFYTGPAGVRLTPAQRVQYMHARAHCPTCNPARTVVCTLRYYPKAYAKPIGPTVAQILVHRAAQSFASLAYAHPGTSARTLWAMAWRAVRSTANSRMLRY